MSTYPGLSSATRESVSLDEDELSDVEDEVFIRDGRSSYTVNIMTGSTNRRLNMCNTSRLLLAEDRGVKRPLMAPRRKIGKPDLASRLKNRPPCRVMCVPCCYAFAALTIFLGLIVLVIILVSLFPLPLDRFKSWILSKSSSTRIPAVKVLPCNDLVVTDVWSYNLPKLASESALRSLDVNADGVDDIVFGFGLAEDVQLPQQWFCPMFMGVKSPCQGGVIALDGSTGHPLWRRWLPHMVFTIYCTADFTGDQTNDCLASGKGGVLSAINGRDGSIIWDFVNNKTSLVMDIYSGSLIPDQDGDGVLDVIASHTIQTGGKRMGFLLIISGKSGKELARVATPNATETLFAPQHFLRGNGENTIIFGTGSQNTSGALYMAPLDEILANQMKPVTLYKDSYKGVLSPVILIDINGDSHDDIVSAMFNSTIIAIDGQTLTQLWNFTINNSETLSTPTPGYFTSDNVTDFLIKYQTGPGFPIYYYSQTIIIDGRTGRPIYNRPIIDTVGTQMGGLTISMENLGQDMFVYWVADCKNFEGRQDTYSFSQTSNIWQKSRADLCKLRFNSTMVAKLYSLNQYMGPPGVLLYSSENRTSMEYNGSRTPLEEVRSYLNENPDFNSIFFGAANPQLDVLDDTRNIKNDALPLPANGGVPVYRNMKFNNDAPSNFRHRDDGQGLVKDFTREQIRNRLNNKNDHMETEDKDYDQADIPWVQNQGDDEMLGNPAQFDYPSETDDQTYADTDSSRTLLNSQLKQMAPDNIPRDPRRSIENATQQQQQTTDDPTQLKSPEKRKTQKKNLADVPQIYSPNDYKNIYLARQRLLHDLNDLPTDILRDTFRANRERQLRNNKFQQRDLRFRENEADEAESLWDLESEKELEDKENGFWRGKRDLESTTSAGIPRITSAGLLLKPLADSKSKQAIDIVFVTYWVLPKIGGQVILEKDALCIAQKMLKSTSVDDKYYNLEQLTKEDLFTKMCLEERGVLLLKPTASFSSESKTMNDNDNLRKSPYYNQIVQLTLGQMTVYRLRLECKCEVLKVNERCAHFLNASEQAWPSYLGTFGNGIFKTRV